MSKPDSSLQTIAAQVLKTSKIDEQAAAKLLLLGMMNKSLRLPYAVVKPRQQEVAKDKRNGKELTKIVPVEARGIKRKAEDADDVCDEGDKKEKRLVHAVRTQQVVYTINTNLLHVFCVGGR